MICSKTDHEFIVSFVFDRTLGDQAIDYHEKLLHSLGTERNVVNTGEGLR